MWRDGNLKPYPLEGRVEELIESGDLPEGWKPTGRDKNLYVELSEPIVRMAVRWQDREGRIVDPYLRVEVTTATPRFVGALSFMIRVGRCLDLLEACVKSMTVAARDLSEASQRPVSGPEFYVKELMAGYWALKDKVDESLVEEWEHLLGGYNPEETYTAVFSKMSPDRVRNFSTFALAGEGFKLKAGLADNRDFITRYLRHQLGFFTDYGMYRDPGDPLTYDYTARMNLALLLYSGYSDENTSLLDELLRRGGLTTLLYLSPLGQAPFGGRSNQFNFNEATITLICEYEANRYKRAGRLDLAGAFKRAARLSALSIKRWLMLKPFRHIKNGFHPSTMHGCEEYGGYSVYSLLIASQLGFAHLLADDSIEEKPAPFEVGGYILHLPEAFHKVFATSGGYHIEVETSADHKYDATGLGRIHKASAPSEIGLSTPITPKPRYKVAVQPSPRGVAVGPGWRDSHTSEIHWLADYKLESVNVSRIKESKDETRFRITYILNVGLPRILEEYTLNRDGVEVSVKVEGANRALMQFPLLETDGLNRAEVQVERGHLKVRYLNHTYEVWSLHPEDPDTWLEPFKAPNRNAIYRVGCFESLNDEMEVRVEIT